MEKSNIYSKLFEFKQKEITLSKDTQAYNYSYANLKQIQDKLSPILKELKLLIIHFNRGNEIVTQIRDIESDTFVESFLEIGKVETTTTTIDTNTNKNKTTIEYNDKDPQGVGSILTYYRRYNLIELLDLEIEDDDGKGGSGRAKAKSTPKEVYTMTVTDVDNWNGKVYPGNSVYVNQDKKTISDEQVKKLEAHEKYIKLEPKK